MFKGDVGSQLTLMDLFKSGYSKLDLVKKRLEENFEASEG